MEDLRQIEQIFHQDAAVSILPDDIPGC